MKFTESDVEFNPSAEKARSGEFFRGEATWGMRAIFHMCAAVCGLLSMALADELAVISGGTEPTERAIKLQAELDAVGFFARAEVTGAIDFNDVDHDLLGAFALSKIASPLCMQIAYFGASCMAGGTDDSGDPCRFALRGPDRGTVDADSLFPLTAPKTFNLQNDETHESRLSPQFHQ